MTPMPRDDATAQAQAEAMADKVIDSRAALPLVRGMTEFERERWRFGITDALLTFAAQAAQRENAECEQLALEIGSRATHSGWTADTIAHLIRTRHAPTARDG